jgi:group II intron reverse transcriptase/maturase
VDIDLEKFFDNVPQDRLMSLVHRIINDGDTESLIRKYLKAGVMVRGRYEKTELGTPQGGNLSPLLSNIMLNELDRELEKRGLNFTRYADDCIIAVRSEASAKRVMHSITEWIEKKLGLKVNATKTKITRPDGLKYLGFGFYKDFKTEEWKCKPHKDSIAKFKRKLKQLTERRWSINLRVRIAKINQVTRGWINYYALGSMKTVMAEMDAHLRTRLRMIIWKQWKVPAKRQWGLQKLGIGKDLARVTAYCGNRYYWVVTKTCVVRAISKEKLARAGLVSLSDYYAERHMLKLI